MTKVISLSDPQTMPHPIKLNHWDDVDLLERLSTLPPCEQWAVKNPICTDNGEHIAEAIRAGTAVAGSDGAYDDITSYSTSGFRICPTLQDIDDDTGFEAQNQVPGEQRNEAGLHGVTAAPDEGIRPGTCAVDHDGAAKGQFAAAPLVQSPDPGNAPA